MSNKLIEDKIERANYLDTNSMDFPNENCRFAHLKGYLIQDSFSNYNENLIPFFSIENEDIFLLKKDNNYLLISKVNPIVKQLSCWKTLASILKLSMAIYEKYNYKLDILYNWLKDYCMPEDKYYLNTKLLSKSHDDEFSCGRVLKVNDIFNIANIIELLAKDDMAYTASSLLYSSLELNFSCFFCELDNCNHKMHNSEEPEYWEKITLIQNLEIAVVQATRAVEAILGTPPKQKNKAGVFSFKKKCKDLLDLDFDNMFGKANKTYKEYYYELLEKLRNQSAHSYGNIHYDLELEQTITAQCFAYEILNRYLLKKVSDQKIALNNLNFNLDLLCNN